MWAALLIGLVAALITGNWWLLVLAPFIYWGLCLMVIFLSGGTR